MTTAGEYLTSGEVARLLHVSPKTVNRWARRGLLPSVQTLGGHLRFSKSDVEEARAQMFEAANGAGSADS